MPTRSADQGHGAPLGRRPYVLGLLVAALAVAVRLLYLLEAGDDPTTWDPIVDARTYHELAAGLARDGVLDERFLWQSTFYPFFLAGVYKLAGVSVLAAKLAQALLAGFTCLLAVRLGRLLHGATAGLLAGLLVALCGPLLFFELQLLATGWTAFWTVALANLAVDLVGQPRLRTGLLLGAAAALAVLTRPTFIPVAATLLAWLAWGTGRGPCRRDGLRALAAALLACALVLVPYAAAMRSLTGHAGIVPPSGGINLHVGNNPDYARTINIRPGLAWEELVAEPQRHGHAPGPWHGQPWYLAQVRAFAREHPGAALALLGRKATQLISSRELPRNVDVYVHRQWSRLLGATVFRLGPWGFPLGLLLPLAAVGLLRGGWRGAGPLLVILAVYGLTLVLVFVSARYRAPLLPLLAVLAGHGLVAAWHLLGTSRTRPLAVAVAVVLAVTLVGTVPGPFAQERTGLEAELYYGVGWNRYQAQEWDEAARYLERAIALHPGLPEAHNFLGITRARLGDLESAVAHFETAVRLKPDYADAINNLQVARARLSAARP